MTELEFGERLKQYRKAKNMTQQELADRLGVSNKSISRWESGSYPDVATLGPLAKVLGVTVDDLLGETPPLRALERADWQNLLSFAFAIGGGILYFLLDMFVLSLICYLLYLGAMAYGAYLQKHYTYHSKWFYRANLVMDFFINLELLASPVSFAAAGTAITGASAYLTALLTKGVAFYAILILLVWLLLAVALTAVTAYFVKGDGAFAAPKLRPELSRKHFSWKKAPPALCPILLTAYWCIFYSPNALPEPLYRAQNAYFYLLLAALAILTLIYLLLVNRPWMLLPAGGMLLGCTAYTGSLSYWVWSPASNLLMKAAAQTPAAYVRFGRPGWTMFVLMSVLVGAYLLCCFIRVRPNGEST